MAYHEKNLGSLCIDPAAARIAEIDPYATGERLYFMRKIVHGLSQEALADALYEIRHPVSLVAISRWENGVLPNLVHLKALAYLYGCKVDDLLVTREPNAQVKAA